MALLLLFSLFKLTFFPPPKTSNITPLHSLRFHPNFKVSVLVKFLSSSTYSPFHQQFPLKKLVFEGNKMKTQGKKTQTTEQSGCSSFQMGLRRPSCCTRPAWLLSTLADLDQKIKILVKSSNNDKEADTFAQRAECYYQQRPQLLSLLLDLYNAYLSLAERYCQSLHKHHKSADHHHHKALSVETLVSTSAEDNHIDDQDCQSDAESSLSYQLPSSRSVSMVSEHNKNYADEIMSELVIKSVEYDLMAHELGVMEIQSRDSSRKIELQRSLLEVLESERLILLNENAGLRYKVEALIDENKGLASESVFMKRKAGELARCVLKMREDRRVCMLGRKIEELTRKIYGLEKKNREYHQQLSRREKMQCCSCKKDHQGDDDTTMGKALKSKDVEAVSTEACFDQDDQRGSQKKGVRISKVWDKVKNSDLLFLCRPLPSKYAT